jgi:predicted amino acid dehydrogenase
MALSTHVTLTCKTHGEVRDGICEEIDRRTSHLEMMMRGAPPRVRAVLAGRADELHTLSQFLRHMTIVVEKGS